MVTTASIGVLVKTLFIILFSVITAALVYLFIFGDLISCFDVHSRWFFQTTADFTTFFVVIGAWIAYKESSWVLGAVLVVAMYFLGSLVSIGYILAQFDKLSPEESLRDPLYFVLARREKRDDTRGPSVVAARVMFFILGCLLIGVLIYALFVELSPSYPKYFTSCFITMATDLYINVMIFSVWIAYKESSWSSALIWIVLLVCFRSVAICAYIMRQLFYLSSQQPAYLIIFKSNRDLHSSDPLLMAHPNP